MKDVEKRSIVKKFKDDNVRGAQYDLLEELFNDIYIHRKRVYLVNFFRGISFGIGSVLGGTVLIAILIWVLSLFVQWVPFWGDFISDIIDVIQRN